MKHADGQIDLPVIRSFYASLERKHRKIPKSKTVFLLNKFETFIDEYTEKWTAVFYPVYDN
jgi:hypothetical protein